MVYKGRWVYISAYKHDGSIHRRWDRGFVVEDNDDYIVIASKRAKVIEANGRCWFTHEPAVTIFSKKDFWNAICMFKTDGICYYCNLASPCVLTKDSIAYVDYDLDAKLFPDKSIRVLDRKEYLRHKKKYEYSDDLDRVLTFQMGEIINMMKKNIFPFVDSEIQRFYNIYQEKIIKRK